ncbi:hypothetical protein T459_02140 [Capsicum annuum]|uniref:ATPase F1/V1/A1 complex alpha/beta subunit N-terminal domain-containing protein n=1 Tax=Capsicum annuum TaxID=4072 RepID=A0A2G3AJ91_CAPAN|nr:hypothetical protein T459_02140 [Capsicum annuum]
MVEFASSVKGITLNLDNEIVWIVLFSSDIAIKNGDLVKRTRSIMDVPVEKAMLGSEALDGPVSSDSHYRWMVRYQKLMPYHLAILHKPILDGRNGDMGKEEAGLKERSELSPRENDDGDVLRPSPIHQLEPHSFEVHVMD